MKRKYALKVANIVIVIFCLGSITYLFLWGKLFVFSPICPGFSKKELKNIVVYVQKGSEYYDCKNLDNLTPDVEKFHDLKFCSKPKIFFFRDRESYLQRSVTRARFYSYPNGCLVVSPWAITESSEGKLSVELYIKHELSHTLLMQNMGIPAVMSYPKWLMEGIAVYSVKQMGTTWYPSKEETYTYMKQGNFMPPEYFKTRKENSVKLEVKYRIPFMYSEFACIVDHLIETKGKDKFLVYMKGLMKGDRNDKVFKEVYGITFDDFLMGFKMFVEKSHLQAVR